MFLIRHLGYQNLTTLNPIIMKYLISKAHFLICMITIAFFGCSTPPLKDSDYMSFGSVEYISGFPRSITLRDRVDPAIDVIGARNFAIIEDKMILNATDPSGFISVLSLPDHGHLGKFIQI